MNKHIIPLLLALTLLVGAVPAMAQQPANAGPPAFEVETLIAPETLSVYQGQPVLDLDYIEDSGCDTDMNVVMNQGGGFIEIQGTAEGHAFRRNELDEMLNLDPAGIIQADENIHIAANNGLPIVYREGTYIEKNFKKILERIVKAS